MIEGVMGNIKGGEGMSYVIDLPSPVEARIEQEAQKAGVSPAQLLNGSLFLK
jgi:hypothetical protein